MMGYSREQAVGALRQSNWDVEQALDHLEAGEEEFEDEVEGEDVGAVLDEQLQDAIDKFLDDPQFKNIRDQIRADPDKVDEYLEQLKHLAPQLHDTFVANPALVEEVLAAIEEGSIDHEEDGQDWIDDDQIAHINAQGGKELIKSRTFSISWQSEYRQCNLGLANL